MPQRWNRRGVLFALAAPAGLWSLAGCGGRAEERDAGIRPDPTAPTSMKDLTRDYVERRRGAARARVDRGEVVLALLRRLAGEECMRFPVSEQFHCRQAATRALLADPDDEELVVAALCHDVGDLLGRPHAPASAMLLARHVRPDLHAVVAHHTVFQRRFTRHLAGDAREPAPHLRHRDAPWYELALRFTEELDQPSFDPAYETLPLEHFEPMVRRVFAKPRHPA